MGAKQAMRGNQDFCLAEFASAVCWPSTPGNHTVTMPCPHYVPGVRKHGQVSRRCFWSSNVDEATNGSVGHWRFSDVEFRDCLAVVESSSSPLGVNNVEGQYCPGSKNTCFHISSWETKDEVWFFYSQVRLSIILGGWVPSDPAETRGTSSEKTLDTNIQWFCRLLTTLTTLTVTATHSWVFVEALYLHNTVLIHIFHSAVSSIVGYIITGWVTPVILTAVWVILRLTITTGTTCWILDDTPHSPSRLLLSLSPVVMLLFNLAFSINVFRLVLVKMKSQTSGETSRVKTLLKSICVLILIFGIYHLIFLPLDLMESQHAHYGIEQLEMIKLYCRHVMEGLQGFCAALILCFMNKEVTAELKRRYHQSRMRGAVLDTHRQSHLLETRVHLNDDGTTETVKGNLTKWPRKPLSRTLRLRRHSSPFKKPSGPRQPSALCHSTIVIVENTTAVSTA
ncbi:Parathyroid hormone/parathyroid hormone- peptide receptor [Clonorchis sinensis]|uniref:Parathyroid hormone/parathyroid hormone- peptide receptor n=1 Tax=Clonorchis sinensis TaxID=79923 RepID=A0A8T1MXM6_CLOSI|nr:Parathyroid hormone/parathyroid hormone- peptide receptor [Clonorchis sinensis]